MNSGVAAIVAACTIWGLSPLYYKHLSMVPAEQLLAHRTFWSFVTFFALTAMQGKLPALWRLLRNTPMLGRVAIAALMVSANWFLFIFAIQNDRTTETSLGYYIFPLVSVLLGVFVLKEGLSRCKRWRLRWQRWRLAC
ncbi:EamA family transporter [Pseudoprimorskyibacter insulae]|uniref:EamA domain-containing protein n=1 Tax=Pseudoprimorskyibacter insulae TaxID=1695997 RepID=A0A2R8AXX7_9RHOB|nr:EamA family transporter [Pseudoprimorskyibacter insulae]SPF80895.1 hypothetical protein PRI8871_02708 [Pseudoprimorskyibacter insulae]